MPGSWEGKHISPKGKLNFKDEFFSSVLARSTFSIGT
jgi:hypothetical protein